MQYKVGIIGCGNIGSEFNSFFTIWPVTHARAYDEHPLTKLIAVADCNKEKVQKCARDWRVPNYYLNYIKMLKKEKFDIISICTPYETHAQIIRDIVNLSPQVKGIFCEKPFTNSLQEAKEVTELCKKKKIVLTVNFQRRHDLFYQYVQENLDRLVGDIKKVIFTYTGGIINNGSHVFDLLRFYFGDIESLEARFEEKKTDPNLIVLLKFKSGLQGIITSCLIPQHCEFELKIMGEKAKLDLLANAFFSYSYRYFKNVKSKIFPSVTISTTRPSFPINKKFKRDLFIRAVDDLIKSISEQKIPISSAKNGIASLELVSAALISAQENKKIKLPLKKVNLKLPLIKGEPEKWKKN